MSNEETFDVAVTESKRVIIHYIREMAAVHDWLIYSEDDIAISKISIMALGLILSGQPTPIAIAFAVKGYHEVLEER